MSIRGKQLEILCTKKGNKLRTIKSDSPLFSIHYMQKLTGEDEIANRIAIELKTLYQLKKLKCIFTHPRNETSNYIGLTKAKCLGMIPGAPDYFFISKDNHLLVEVKTAVGTLSENQKKFKHWCADMNVDYIVVRSWEELKEKLKEYGMIS